MALSKKVDVYSMVTDRVVELLEAGTVPWRKPWKGRNLHPCNGKSGAKYRGINPFMLEMTRACEGYEDHRWLTYKQAKEAGGNVRRGERSTLVVFWKWFETTDRETGKVKQIPCLKYFRVFNANQCEDLDEKKLKAETDDYTPTEWEAIEAAEQIGADWLASSGIGDRIEHGGNRAVYRPGTDSLGMPDRDRFEVPAEYYSTMFHEMVHSTGHESRLNRFQSGEFGKESYAKEELIAEMGSAFLCGECGIEGQTIENSAAYLQGWLKALKNDKRLVASAAAAGQKASDLILGRSYGQTAEDGAQQALTAGV
jgi:antirestriction protein ArdC